MKRFSIISLALILILSFTACSSGTGSKNTAGNPDDGAGRETTENGDAMTIKGLDGNEVAIGSDKWPDSELGKSIPAFQKGRIDGTVETENSLMITIFEVDQKDAAAYIEENKPNFPLNNTEMNAEGMISWGGENDAGLRLSLTHQDDSFSITLSKVKE